jgi:competence protein ComGC
MKAFGLITLLLVLGIVGYLIVRQGPAGQDMGLTEVAAQAHQAGDRARSAMLTADLANIRTQVNVFQMRHNRKPASLQELKDEGQIALIPEKAVYDPATGEVTLGR